MKRPRPQQSKNQDEESRDLMHEMLSHITRFAWNRHETLDGHQSRGRASTVVPSRRLAAPERNLCASDLTNTRGTVVTRSQVAKATHAEATRRLAAMVVSSLLAAATAGAQAEEPPTTTPSSVSEGAPNETELSQTGELPAAQPQPEAAEQGAKPASPAALAPGAPPSEAVHHYQRGRDLYHEGRYREAIVELQAALKLDPTSPELTYNVARVYELLGDIDTALRYYARSRALLPTTALEERERTTTTIQRLEGARLHDELGPAETRGVADAAFWSVTSVGLAALAGGAATGVLALQSSKRAKAFVVGADGSVGEREQELQRADHFALASDVMLAGGATLGVAAVLLYALRERPTQKGGAQLGAEVSPSAAFLTLKGSL